MVSDTQRHSILLSVDENEQVVRLLGERCQPLVMSVVQVFQTGAPDHGSWRKRDAGVLVLVKDNGRRSYFFRLYCLSRRQLVWEHEVYSNMVYNTPKPFFHQFEAEDCVTAFNFADEQEANLMNTVLKENMAARQRRRQERRRQASQNATASNHLSSHHSVSTPTLSNGSIPTSSHSRTAKAILELAGGLMGVKDKKRQGEKKKFTKADIGLPQDFRHVSHVGWNPNTGFDIDDVENSALRQFFDKAGVSEHQLKDKSTREFIYAFINTHGGIDRVKDEVQAPDVPPPPVPARSAPTNASIRTAPPPPPPPSRSQLPPPPPPSQAPAMVPGPPPPPPQRLLPHRQDSNRGAPTPPPPPPPPPMQTTTGAPAPPPPPPPTTATAAPPSAPAAPVVPDMRAALMDAIRSGKALKPVTLEEKPRNGSSGDSRAELMDEIRQGKELKAVVPAPRPPPSNSMPSDSLAGALARALADRSRAIHSDSSGSSSGEDEEDDEWED